MFHWIIIILGIIFLSFAISNPLYNITINKFLNLSLLLTLFLRIMLFILSILVIFFGLYIESIDLISANIPIN